MDVASVDYLLSLLACRSQDLAWLGSLLAACFHDAASFCLQQLGSPNNACTPYLHASQPHSWYDSYVRLHPYFLCLSHGPRTLDPTID